MDISNAITIFDALSQETRLNTLRSLVKAGPAGLAAGKLGAELGIPHNTLSFHLNHLSSAGVVSSHKQGRSIIYSANFQAISGLIEFLVKDCCSKEVAQIEQNHTTGCSVIELSNCCR